MRGNSKGDLQYREVPLVETLPTLASVGRVFVTGSPAVDLGSRLVSLVRPGLMGFSMGPSDGEPGTYNNQVSSKRRLTTVDAALAEDVGNNTISMRLRRRRNIDFLLSKSPVVIEIADGDIPQQTEVVDLCPSGGSSVVGACSDPPSASGDVHMEAGPSPLSAPGVYLPVWNLMHGSLLSK